MQKRKVKKIVIEYTDGSIEAYQDIDATFSISHNARKKNGFANLQDWNEFHITWIQYITKSAPVEESSEPKVVAEDYMDDPNFVGIEYGKPIFRESKTQYNFEDFFGGENNSVKRSD